MIIKKNKFSLPIVLITLLSTALGLLFLSPFYIIIVNAFKTQKELFENTLSLPITYTFNNFKQAFTDLDFVRSLSHSLFITITSVILIIIFSSMAAWKLERTKNKISDFILIMFIASMIIPFQAVMLPLIRLMGNLHLLNMDE